MKPVYIKMAKFRKTAGDTKYIHTVSFYHWEQRYIYLITGADLRAHIVPIGLINLN